MLYNFKINIVVRLGILMLLVGTMVFSFYQEFFLTTGFAGLLLIVTVFSLFYYVDQTNRDLAHFFESINYNDFTSTGTARHKGESFGELHDGFNLINRKFQDIRAEKEANHQFLQTVVEHVDIGLLCLSDEGDVILLNKTMQKLIHKSYLVNVSSLEKVDETLFRTIQNIQAGQRELIKINIDNKLLQLAVQAVELNMNKQHLRLISFQNIQSELEEQELVAWQKLIRILTHEIMNSVAPIASLSSTLHDVIGQKEEIEKDTLKMVRNSLSVIQRRSEGLLGFTETYRSLTRIPPPNFQLIDGNQLLEEMETLFLAEAEAKHVPLTFHLPTSSPTFHGDPNLLQQVLINLIKNAMDAVKSKGDDGQVHIHLQQNVGGKILIQVVDNGQGISPEMMEQIFVPFFTTKEQGSGIGLSLSRQIMQVHKGSIEVQSVEGEGTVVTLVL
ncbi:MAG: histidine kinase [Saprospiraceae bacterium]|nr:MAG: histidine kinase [Saprospiraceae bacterium]